MEGRQQNKTYLQSDERRLETILSNTPAVIGSYQMIEGKKVFTYINDNIVNVLGFEAREIIDEPELWFERVHPEDLKKVKAVQKKLAEGHIVHLEYRFNCKSGLCRWLHEKQKQIINEKGETEVVAVCWDITEEKLAERLIQARVNLLSYSYGHTLEEMLQKALDEVGELVSSPLAFYHFVSKDEKKVVLKAWSTKTFEFCKIGVGDKFVLSVDEAGIWVDCLLKRRPVIHNDYSSLHYRKGVPQGHAKLKRALYIPIIRRDRVVAILGVGNKPSPYTEQDIRKVTFIADVAWSIAEQKLSMERVHYFSFHDTLTGLYNRAFMEEEMRRLDTNRQLPISIIMADLNNLKLVNDIYGHTTGDKVLKTIAKILKSNCRQEDIIARWGGDEFVILLPQTEKEKAERLCQRVREKCKETHVRDMPISLAMGVAVKTDTISPLVNVLNEAERFMYEQKLADIKNTGNANLSALLKTLRTKSFETEGHVRRMQLMAMEFGEELGLPDSELNRLSLLITLHDIGKINIPGNILTKKGPLSKKEWEIMKRHPETGYRIIRSTEEFAHVALDVLSHHERWDGSGYPRGLKGKQIPFLARITAIVDAYEVMTNGRPYKEKLSLEEAAQEIKRASGKQFDPELVEKFLEGVEKTTGYY